GRDPNCDERGWFHAKIKASIRPNTIPTGKQSDPNSSMAFQHQSPCSSGVKSLLKSPRTINLKRSRSSVDIFGSLINAYSSFSQWHRSSGFNGLPQYSQYPFWILPQSQSLCSSVNKACADLRRSTP